MKENLVIDQYFKIYSSEILEYYDIRVAVDKETNQYWISIEDVCCYLQITVNIDVLVKDFIGLLMQLKDINGVSLWVFDCKNVSSVCDKLQELYPLVSKFLREHLEEWVRVISSSKIQLLAISKQPPVEEKEPEKKEREGLIASCYFNVYNVNFNTHQKIRVAISDESDQYVTSVQYFISVDDVCDYLQVSQDFDFSAAEFIDFDIRNAQNVNGGVLKVFNCKNIDAVCTKLHDLYPSLSEPVLKYLIDRSRSLIDGGSCLFSTLEEPEEKKETKKLIAEFQYAIYNSLNGTSYNIRYAIDRETQQYLISIEDVCSYFWKERYVNYLCGYPELEMKPIKDVNGKLMHVFDCRNIAFACDRLRERSGSLPDALEFYLISQMQILNRRRHVFIPVPNVNNVISPILVKEESIKEESVEIKSMEKEQTLEEKRVALVVNNLDVVRLAFLHYLQTHPDQWSCSSGDEKVIVHKSAVVGGPCIYDCRDKGIKILHFDVLDDCVISWIAGKTDLTEREVRYQLCRIKEAGVFGTFIDNDLTAISKDEEIS